MWLVGGGGTRCARRTCVQRIGPSSPLRAFLFALLIACLGTSSVYGGPFSEIVAFDSSLTDTGNVQEFLQSNYGISFTEPPYYNGRFTNGKVYIEYLAEELGLPAPVASLLGGKNYSFGGALAGPGMVASEYFPPGWPNIGTEIDQYLSEYTPTGNELFVVSGGQNNMSYPSFFEEDGGDVSILVDYMVDHITTLANAGGNNFLVALLAPLGQLPANRGGPDEALFDQLASDFNTLLVSELDTLEDSLLIDISILDIHAAYTDIFANPGKYGLVNATDSAFDGTTVVPNPDQYLFWDEGHPTTAAHAILANAAIQAFGVNSILVPEPSTAALAVSALGSLLLLTFHRRKQA